MLKRSKMNERCGLQVSVPPGDLQVQLHRAEVVDIHGERLGKWAEQVEHFAGHTAHHHVIGQALQLRHLDNQNKQTSERWGEAETKGVFLQLAKAGRFCEKASKELKAGEKKDVFHIANKYHENTKTNNEPTSVICLTKAWGRPSVAQTSNVSKKH